MKFTVFFDQINRTNFQIEAASKEEAREKARNLYLSRLVLPFPYLQTGWIVPEDGEDKTEKKEKSDVEKLKEENERMKKGLELISSYRRMRKNLDWIEDIGGVNDGRDKAIKLRACIEIAENILYTLS